VGADKRVISTSEEETFRVGCDLAKSLKLPAHILLYGDLGAGKTALARGLAAGFGLENTERRFEPTFTLINEYRGRVEDLSHRSLSHRDRPPRRLGLDEIFDDPNAAVITEWAERLGDFQTPGPSRSFSSTLTKVPDE
jgi:tRNA threonylcarbamoyladenosine biosynthesis protein TsaE